jgi:hypothetical protein
MAQELLKIKNTTFWPIYIKTLTFKTLYYLHSIQIILKLDSLEAALKLRAAMRQKTLYFQAI